MPSLSALDDQILAALSAAGLTEVATIRNVAVAGYFRDGYVEMGDGDLVVEAREITFDCRADDLPSVDIDDPVTVSRGGVVLGNFRIARLRPPDGSGRRLIYLGLYV